MWDTMRYNIKIITPLLLLSNQALRHETLKVKAKDYSKPLIYFFSFKLILHFPVCSKNSRNTNKTKSFPSELGNNFLNVSFKQDTINGVYINTYILSLFKWLPQPGFFSPPALPCLNMMASPWAHQHTWQQIYMGIRLLLLQWWHSTSNSWRLNHRILHARHKDGNHAPSVISFSVFKWHCCQRRCVRGR